jgi:hypothetical protein
MFVYLYIQHMTVASCEGILFHKGFVANLAFPFLFVLVVHIETPQTAEAVENFPTNMTCRPVFHDSLTSICYTLNVLYR